MGPRADHMGLIFCILAPLNTLVNTFISCLIFPSKQRKLHWHMDDVGRRRKKSPLNERCVIPCSNWGAILSTLTEMMPPECVSESSSLTSKEKWFAWGQLEKLLVWSTDQVAPVLHIEIGPVTKPCVQIRCVENEHNSHNCGFVGDNFNNVWVSPRELKVIV
jgi:hypothetical protein